VNLKARAILVGRYILARLQEPSTIKGLITAAAALGWYRLDSNSSGENIAQLGLLIVGAINAALPQRTLYQGKDDVR
jgi:hypothetical protein